MAFPAFREIGGVSRVGPKSGTNTSVSRLFHLNLNPCRCERGSARSYNGVQRETSLLERAENAEGNWQRRKVAPSDSDPLGKTRIV